MATDTSASAAEPVENESSLSLVRVLRVVAPIVVVLVGCALFITSQLPSIATEELQSNMLAALLRSRSTGIAALEGFVDSDGDMVADFPAEADCITPEKLIFAYIPEADGEDEAGVWQALIDAIADKTGVPTEYVKFETVDVQAIALRDGELHVTAFNTGAVPMAVAGAGFVPVSTFGKSDGTFGVTMQMLVPADSALKSLEDLKSEGEELPRVEFVAPNSNSGFKAALVLLMSEYDLYPQRDYEYSFSMGYFDSMKDVANNEATVAPVVSDMLDQAIAEGIIKQESVRSIYESERFPPAALGYSYKLSPALRDAIRDVLLNFDWTGTPLAEKLNPSGSTQFVPVNYKDDWANIRHIDDVIEEARR